MKFQRETVQVVLDSMHLLEKHWREIAHYQDIKLEPDHAQYLAIEKLGMIRTFTARDERDELIGYAVFFVKSNLHYKSSIQASQDVIFIDPTRRGFGMKFIGWCDEQLQAEGIQAVYHHVKSAHNFGPMLERLGYQLVDLIYAKRLD